MKAKLLSGLSLMALLLTSCFTMTGGNVSINNGDESEATVKKQVKIGEFKEIEASRGIKIVFTQGSNPGVASVATTPSAEKYLKVRVKDNTLEAYYESSDNPLKEIKGPSIITVSSPTLTEVELSSAASLEIKGNFESSNQLVLDMSSAASFQANSLQCAQLGIDITSASSISIDKLNGDLIADLSSASSLNINSIDANNISLDASSASKIDVDNVKANKIIADASSTSKINLDNIKATTISVDATSASKITLAGNTQRLNHDSSSGAKVNYGNLKINK